MIGAWVGYSLLVAMLLSAAAAALEPAVRLARAPTRVLWVVAMGATLILILAAPVRPSSSSTLRGVVELPAETAPNVGVVEPPKRGASERLAALPATLGRALSVLPAPGPVASRTLAVGWLAISLTLLGLAHRTSRRYSLSLRRWPLRLIDGVPVRLTAATGPAVFGFVRPEIAVPGWLLGSPSDVQRMVVMHEREHVRSGDQLVIGAGGLIVIILPWVLPLWWMLHRLRLAIEIDCDARVLRRGATLGEYGSALIEAAARSPRLVLGTALSSGPKSSLEWRLQTMNRRPTGQRIARVMPLLPLGLAAALVACATELPTTAEIEAMDVVELESRTQRLVAFDGDSVRYYLDDVAITREEARAVEAENIASISVYRDDEGGRASEVRMTSRSGADSALSSDVLAEDRIAFRGASPPDSIVVELEMDSPEVVGYGVDVRPTTADPAASAGAAGAGLDFPGSDLSARAPAEPLYVIDGEVAEAADFNRLAPQTIASISVLKGASATATYGSRGANGVLLIATKRDGSAPPAQ